MDVFLLSHERALDGGCGDEKLIGIYSTRERAEEVLAVFQTLPGFCDYPDRFTISPYQLDESHWTEGFATI
jgi:hypothetical protein